MTVWMREDGNAALLLPPHPCNTDKHHAGDISAHGRYYCEGLHAAQTKSTHSFSNLEPPGRTALHSEPKQSMILNKPVIEKSTLVPFSITVSSKEIQTFKHLNYFSQIVCMYIVPIPAWNILIQSLYFATLQLSPPKPCVWVQSWTLHRPKFCQWKLCLPRHGKRLLMNTFKSSACSYPADHKPCNQLGTHVAEPFLKS